MMIYLLLAALLIMLLNKFRATTTLRRTMHVNKRNARFRKPLTSAISDLLQHPDMYGVDITLHKNEIKAFSSGLNHGNIFCYILIFNFY